MWAANNNLQLNCAKTHEIVFGSRRLRWKAEQPALPSPDIERVDKLTILDVVVNSSLTDIWITSAVYLLPVLVCCMPCENLEIMAFQTSHLKMFHATVIGNLMCCSPAWHDFCSAAEYVWLDSFLRRFVKLGYVGHPATVTGMFLEADDALLRKILYNKAHFLHTYLPASW